ncbi:MAG: CHAT domain-containing protein [Anaerolineae bacterium]
MDTLILRIDQPAAGASEYPVTLTRVEGDELLGEATFPLDLAPPGVANPLTAQQIRSTFATTTSESAELPRIGAQLYALVGQGDIHTQLDPHGGSHRVLLDIRPAELRNLPWELMAREGLPVMAGANWPICRGNLDGQALDNHEWPLRVLVVVGSRAGDQDVQAEEEVAALIQSIREREADIDLLVMNRPSRRHIMEAFEDPPDLEQSEAHQGFKPHVLHFIGHGGIRQNSQESYLQLWDETGGQAERWTADDIRTDFGPRGNPRLVVVNACRTANVAANGLWSVTDAFQGVGVPAVIGMRTVVTGQHARQFAGGFYQALVKGTPVDEAVLAGRRRIFQDVTNATKRLEWAAPTLQVSANPETIIRVGQDVDEAERLRVQQMEAFRLVRGLADRRTNRWYAWRNVSEVKPEALRKVLVVKGEEGVGKSAFARMVMERCALRGHELRYVDMAGTSRGDALAVLRRICDGDGSGDDTSLTRPLPAAAFSDFKTTVQQVLGAPLSETSRLAEIEPVDVKRIFEAFQHGLEQAVTTPPLVVVLDHLADIDQEQFRSFLVPHLVVWCAKRQDPNIRLVLLVRQREYDRFQLSMVRTRFRAVQVDDFEPERWWELAQEFVRRNLRPPQPEADAIEALDSFIASLGNFPPGRWKPERLDLLLNRAQLAGWQWVLG